jgi:hypothetical protein
MQAPVQSGGLEPWWVGSTTRTFAKYLFFRSINMCKETKMEDFLRFFKNKCLIKFFAELAFRRRCQRQLEVERSFETTLVTWHVGREQTAIEHSGWTNSRLQ